MAIDLALQDRPAVFDDQYELFDQWTSRKLMRDAQEPNRAVPDAWRGQSVFVRQMSKLMTEVAVAMSTVSDSGLELLETIEEDEVHQLVRRSLPTPEDLSDVVAQCSLMTPYSVRTTSAALRLRFSHHSLHEFFLAKAIRAGTLKIRGVSLPEGVRDFLGPWGDTARVDR
jgi:hypothetical protein